MENIYSKINAEITKVSTWASNETSTPHLFYARVK